MFYLSDLLDCAQVGSIKSLTSTSNFYFALLQLLDFLNTLYSDGRCCRFSISLDFCAQGSRNNLQSL